MLRDVLAREQGEPWQTIRLIAEFYPDDGGPLLAAAAERGEAEPRRSHVPVRRNAACLSAGVALEVMANSDNVLRAGLTPKYIDIPGAGR